jgi:hypothetical protein
MEHLWLDTKSPALPARVASFDLKHLPAEFLDGPYPTYPVLRGFDPIYRMSDGSYFLTRYDDCLADYRLRLSS